MTTTHSNLALVEGEVYVLGDNVFGFYDGFKSKEAAIEKYDEGFVYVKYNKICPVLTTTANLEGIPQLDRKHFVKPKVDVEELAEKWVFETNRHKWSNNDDTAPDNYASFKAGHNAKEAEFTRGHMFDLFCRMQMGRIKTSDDWEQYMNEIQPLSIPASVTLNENNEVIAVQW